MTKVLKGSSQFSMKLLTRFSKGMISLLEIEQAQERLLLFPSLLSRDSETNKHLEMEED